MKNLILPEPSSNGINISEINDDFRGIVIGYKGGKPVGIILYDNCNWFFYKTICTDLEYECEDSLYQLVKYLISKEICDDFKVMEYK